MDSNEKSVGHRNTIESEGKHEGSRDAGLERMATLEQEGALQLYPKRDETRTSPTP
jgi:hypothetical protein